jgi:hypothetical protein
MLGGTLMATETSHGGFAVVAFLPRDGDPGGERSELAPDTTGEQSP